MVPLWDHRLFRILGAGCYCVGSHPQKDTAAMTDTECIHGLESQWCAYCLARAPRPDDDEVRIAIITAHSIDRYRITNTGTEMPNGKTIYEIWVGDDEGSITTVAHYVDNGPYHLAANALTVLAHRLAWFRE